MPQPVFSTKGFAYTQSKVHVFFSVYSLVHIHAQGQWTPIGSLLHTGYTNDCITSLSLCFPYGWSQRTPWMSQLNTSNIFERLMVPFSKGTLAVLCRGPGSAPPATRTTPKFYPWTENPPLPSPVPYRLSYHHSHQIMGSTSTETRKLKCTNSCLALSHFQALSWICFFIYH